MEKKVDYVIKTKGAKNRVANLIADKLRNKLGGTFGDVCKVEVKEITDELTHVIVSEKHHGITFSVSDSIREVSDAYEKKYGAGVISAYLDTRPYFANSIDEWLTELVVVVPVWCNKQRLS